MMRRNALLLGLVLLAGQVWAARAAKPLDLEGHWTLDAERTAEEQPAPQRQRDLTGNLPRTTISVGGVPLPTGGGQPPSVGGSARDPQVLHTPTLGISASGDQLTLTFAGPREEILERGNDQGLISHWSDRKLKSGYETTSRKVSQLYQLRRDGTLLVTVRLNPKQGPTIVHKRVFTRTDAAGP